MKKVPALLFLFCFPTATLFAQRYEPKWDSIDQRATPEWFTEARFGIFIHWGTYSVPAYAPVIPGKLAYAEWYWHAMTNGRYDPKANDLEEGTWAVHQKVYGADFAYQNFASQFKAELFDPDLDACVWKNKIAARNRRNGATESPCGLKDREKSLKNILNGFPRPS